MQMRIPKETLPLLLLLPATLCETTVTDKTWDASLITSITPNVESQQRCQEICRGHKDCKGSTWVTHQAAFFPGSCAIFHRIGRSYIPCKECTSTVVDVQEVCTGACWGMGYEMLSNKVLPKEENCRATCTREPRCHQYTSYIDGNKQQCTLFTNMTKSEFSEGLVVSGGNRVWLEIADKSSPGGVWKGNIGGGVVETFPPFLGCENIPVIPGKDPVGKAARSGHSLTLLPGPPPTLVVCGGMEVGDPMLDPHREPNMFQDCVFWKKGLDTWETFASVAEINLRLFQHEAWAPPSENRILLMSGSKTKWVPSGEPGFVLEHPATGGCLINEGDTFILTGGQEVNEWETRHGNVDRYSVDGHLESLPSLGFPLLRHACGSFTDAEGRKVLMVAKGDPGSSGIFEVGPDNPNGEKTNTMLLYPGAKAWVYGQMMPGRNDLAKSLVSLPGGDFMLVGEGHSDKVSRFSNGTWEEVGRLKVKRRWDATIVADLLELCG